MLLDEWQRLPELWNSVRRAVDDGARGGSFLLAGSALPDPPPTHSGAGRIIRLRMRPLSLAERDPGHATVSLASLVAGGGTAVDGETDWTLDRYVEEIVRSGYPGLRDLPERARRLQLEGYVERLVERDLPDDTGLAVRRPEALRRWMRAHAAATSTTATWETIRDAATPGDASKPSRSSTNAYRDALERVWLLDELPAWLPTRNVLRELGSAPKHHMADPALAAALLGADAATLLSGRSTSTPGRHGGSPLGALFESLAALSVRVHASRIDARVRHLRTARGRQEVDLIVERRDGRVVALESKLARSVGADDVRHLNWLRDRIGDDLVDRVVLTTGARAYRRGDGVAVVPLSLLGP